MHSDEGDAPYKIAHCELHIANFPTLLGSPFNVYLLTGSFPGRSEGARPCDLARRGKVTKTLLAEKQRSAVAV